MKTLSVAGRYLLGAALVMGMTMVGTIPVHAFEAKITGQVNQMLMWVDNGDDSDLFITDNINSSTRFRLTGEEKFNNIKIGFNIELEAVRNASSSVDIPNTNDGGFTFNDRKLEAYFDTSFGKISIGKGDGAANATSEVDLSGTAVIMYSGITDTASSFSFIDSTTKNKVTTVGATRSNFDGLSRNERLRYDTPSFGGVNLAASITNGDAWELAALYAVEFSGNKLAAAIGYIDTEDRAGGEFTQVGASASWLTPFGLNFTAAVGQRDFEGQTKRDRIANGQTDDSFNYYFKVGYIWDIHAVAIDYGMTEDLDLKNDESQNYGVAYVIKPWDGVELYTAAKIYELDRNNQSIEDITQFMAGTRIKF